MNVHSSCLDKIKIDKSLGGIDDDVGGKVIKAIYIAPKTYAFQYVVDKNNFMKRLGNNPHLKYEKISEDLFMLFHFRGKGVQNDRLGWEEFEKMDKGLSINFKRDFQMKKINMKKTGKEKDCDHFSHKHIFEENTGKDVNKTLWSGRLFIDTNNSVPYGFDISTLKMC